MRIATYNTEWFDELFSRDNRLLADDNWSRRYNVTRAQQLEALGKVFTALDADAIMVIEAPNAHTAAIGQQRLELFAAWAGLRARKALIGFTNETEQEIALLYDPDVLSAKHDPMGAPGSQRAGESPRFDGTYRIDLDIDATLDVVRFSKPPLEALVTHLASGFEFRMIGVHAKSKAPHGADTPDEMTRISIANRRKHLAQCIWLRERIEAHLNAGESLIVLGDFNDGPGLDEYEKLFGRSGLEIVIGEGDGPRLLDPHARLIMSQKMGARPTSARFYISSEKCYLQALLDYVMLSPDLVARRAVWRIWHPFDDPGIYAVPELRDALLTASDHFPVSVDIEF
ncbi:endonuclease/exonuclease/phosphatase family protein [Aliiroseovarius sp. PTFE2010]|uniref:endonuclease/exonuclease/phosphatase family protein n=1 Tax=Aliiroseovarius sp. PTFE2010 TaxID=3417190 RepID=UPI003CF305BA